MPYLSDLLADADTIKKNVCRRDWNDAEREEVEFAEGIRRELEYCLDSEGDCRLIAEDELEEEAEEYCYNVSGISQNDMAWNYIDFARMGRDLTDDMFSVTIHNTRYYAREY